MNPEQNNPLQSPDIQQPYQSPAKPPAPQQTSSPKQPLASPQPQYPYEPPKQTNKFPPVIVGGAVIVLGITVGIFLLLGSGSKPQSSNQTSNPVNNQTATTVPQENDTEEIVQEDVPEKSEADEQTDTQHKNNLSKLVAAVSEYSANNNGKLPVGSEIDGAFISQYLSGQFDDPSTNNLYKIVESDPKSGEVQYETSSACGSDNTIVTGSRRQVAARVLLSDGAYYCATN